MERGDSRFWHHSLPSARLSDEGPRPDRVCGALGSEWCRNLELRMERGNSWKVDPTSDPPTLKFERVTLPTPKEKPNEPRESPLEHASRLKRMATPALKKELNEPRPPMPGLPDDVLGPVFNHLSMRDLESAGLVSRDWCRVVKTLPHWPKELEVRKAVRRAATCAGSMSL